MVSVLKFGATCTELFFAFLPALRFIVSSVSFLVYMLFAHYGAEKIERSVNFIARVESPNTVQNVSLETLFRISEVLHLPTSKLLEDD